MNQIHAFIALDLPISIQEAIEQQTSRLRTMLGNESIRWVASHNLHLTLKFLGNVPTSHLDFIKQMLTQSADAHSAFDLQISGLGSFPNSKRIHILWVGVQAPAGLDSLQRSIESGAKRLGYETEARAFSPHLTLGRVRQHITTKQTQTISQKLATIQLGRIGTARVDSVHLYQSDLSSEGSVYTKLFSTPLR